MAYPRRLLPDDHLIRPRVTEGELLDLKNLLAGGQYRDAARYGHGALLNAETAGQLVSRLGLTSADGPGAGSRTALPRIQEAAAAIRHTTRAKVKTTASPWWNGP